MSWHTHPRPGDFLGLNTEDANEGECSASSFGGECSYIGGGEGEGVKESEFRGSAMHFCGGEINSDQEARF